MIVPSTAIERIRPGTRQNYIVTCAAINHLTYAIGLVAPHQHLGNRRTRQRNTANTSRRLIGDQYPGASQPTTCGRITYHPAQPAAQ
ncbi:hypothetical protein ASG87_03045 [Frateuria sp. Soil773]|nr:hypothetical protein ASG87_03045 [Frateuria sp. Soil773]